MTQPTAVARAPQVDTVPPRKTTIPAAQWLSHLRRIDQYGRERKARVSADEIGVRYINNPLPSGFGFAVRRGLAEFRGEAVAIVMADGSDDPADVIAFYRELESGYDCVFGSRFISRRACHWLSQIQTSAEPPC